MSAAPKLDPTAAAIVASLARGYAAAANLRDIAERRYFQACEVSDDRGEMLNQALRRFGCVGTFALSLPDIRRVVTVAPDGGVSVWPMLATPTPAAADREEFRQPQSGQEVRLSAAAVQDWIERNILYSGDDIGIESTAPEPARAADPAPSPPPPESVFGPLFRFERIEAAPSVPYWLHADNGATGVEPTPAAPAPFSAGCCEWVPVSVEMPPMKFFGVALVDAGGRLEIELAERWSESGISTTTGSPAVAWLRGLAIPEGKSL